MKHILIKAPLSCYTRSSKCKMPPQLGNSNPRRHFWDSGGILQWKVHTRTPRFQKMPLGICKKNLGHGHFTLLADCQLYTVHVECHVSYHAPYHKLSRIISMCMQVFSLPPALGPTVGFSLSSFNSRTENR